MYRSPLEKVGESTSGVVDRVLAPGKWSRARFLPDYVAYETIFFSQEMQDWNKRVIVRTREMSKAEKKTLPWVIPPLPMYKKMTEAIHQLSMIQVGLGSSSFFSLSFFLSMYLSFSLSLSLFFSFSFSFSISLYL